MVNQDEKDVLEKESSALLEQSQDHAEVRRLAKESLEKAKRVLAESGGQLIREKKSNLPETGQSELEADLPKKDKT